MSFSEELRMAFVRADLRFIERHCSRLTDSPVLLSVSKAFTLAQLHPDVEARVVCKSVDEANEVIELLAKLASPGDHVSDKECALEFSNGSAVKVEIRKQRKEVP